jgi:hypothetical protein
MITVDRVAADGLSRERWQFRTLAPGYGDSIVSLVLDSYRIERRDKPAGRFRGAPPPDRWHSSDERPYTSGLPRPRSIPADVLDEAESAVRFRFYVCNAIPENEVFK